MVDIEALRAEAVSKLHQLIAGKISPVEVSKWAESVYFNAKNKKIIESSESLSELFDDLNIASMTHDGVNPMYNKESFELWLKEYTEVYAEEKDEHRV